MKVGQRLQFYHVNQSSSGHYLGDWVKWALSRPSWHYPTAELVQIWSSGHYPRVELVQIGPSWHYPRVELVQIGTSWHKLG